MLVAVLTTIVTQATALPDAVLTSEAAYLVGEPTLAIGPLAGAYSVSPDGQFVIALRGERALVPLSLDRTSLPIVRRDLIVWNRSTGSDKSFPVPDTASNYVTFDWLHGSSSVIVSQTSTTLVRSEEAPGDTYYQYGMKSWIIDARSGNTLPVRSTDDMYLNRWRFSPSPVAPYVVEVSYRLEGHRKRRGTSVQVDESAVVLQTWGSTGAIGKSVELGSDLVNVGSTEWSGDGKDLVVELTKIDSEGKGNAVLVFFNPQTGEIRESTDPIAPRTETPRHRLTLVRTRTELQRGDAADTASSWWLESTEPSKRTTAIVAQDAQGAVLSEDGSLIVYRSNGALFVRQVTQVSLDAYWKAWEAHERTKIISRAKQIGLAAIMYAGDHDDELPPNLDPARDLMLYLKDPALLEGFVWVFKGGKTTEIENVTEEVMGYIPAPGGRVVVYMDTHVKWIPD